MHKLQVVDSHTAGEPTRVVLSGGPDLGNGPLTERIACFRELHDHFRSAIVNEPRGSEVLVGALLCEPTDASCVTGVIFFNNVGFLGMCGHGMIGLVTTLGHLGRIEPGPLRVETPVGIVTAMLHADGTVSIENVTSYRRARHVSVHVDGVGAVSGDVAWGGNWFFLVEDHGLSLEIDHIETLTHYAWRVRQALNTQGFPEVDHVELFGPPRTAGAHSRSFVLCPGKAYDRSPCGTGTSAKLACLAADGKLSPGSQWVQESIIGSTFTGSYRWVDEQVGSVTPSISGRAFVTAEATLLVDHLDPLAWGIRC